MKKFALGLLSVFIILGGVLLTACDKKISLSLSTEEVVIFTNDEQEENYQKKDIDITIENSSTGANVEILKGQDSVRVSPVKHKTGNIYTFTIFGDKSGEAEIKVSAIEDNKQSKILNVKVNTILEQIKSKSDDSVDARTNLYVVKGVSKQLNKNDYFDFEPSTANITDIVWSFEDSGNQEYVKDDVLVAKIENGNLLVLEQCDLSSITLRASFVRNTNVYENVKFEILENSTINHFVIDDKTLYQNNAVATKDVEFDLKRNDSNKSSVNGSIVINSKYNINLEPVVYEKKSNGEKIFLSTNEFEDFFTFEITSKTVNDVENKITYNFKIDAIDTKNINEFGNLYFYLKIGYQDYNFDLTTENVNVMISTTYSATKIEISNENNDSLNNSIVDIFSSYETGNGYKIHSLVLPDDVAIDNSMFFISVDLNQTNLRNLNLPEQDPVSAFVKFYCRGELVTFAPSATGSSVYVSQNFMNSSNIYVSSSEEFDVLEGIDFKFVSVSNATANTNLTMNFYKISTDKNLVVTDAEGNELDAVKHISSNAGSSRQIEYIVKINDISTISGLSLKSSDNSKFKFSDLELLDSNFGGEEGAYVTVKFVVTLSDYNFASSTKFWFEHVTGKKSTEFKIEAFVPLQSASIQNGDKSSADVYKDEQSLQNYVDNAGLIEMSDYNSSSLSRLMVEAGTSLPLNTSFQNATLGEKGVTYKFLSMDALKSAIKIVEGLADDQEIENKANEIFAGDSLDLIANSYYRFFDTINGTLFNIEQNKISLTDNSFKGYVCVSFTGFNQQHETVTLVRFFALESFYSVRYLSSNVQTTLLYTTETLSLNDISRASVDVTVNLRPDEKIPTYSNNLSNFSFHSAIAPLSGESVLLKNKFYSISDISFGLSGKTFKFRITANSTNMQTSVRDVLTLSYTDENGFSRVTEIQIEIRNVKRIEDVQWLNRTADDEIYLNLTTTVSNERSFTISTSVTPSDANDIGLSYAYFATAGSAGDLSITTSSIGQTFNLNINTSTGGYGYLFLLPNDMIKVVDGVKQVLLYSYSEGENGEIIETPLYRKLSELDLYYDEIINGSNLISNYFYNNDNEKIYYKDIIIKIAITIADGSSEGTAIRVYNETDMKGIDYSKYYKVMNNITLNSWVAYNQFNGMFFGKDENIMLRFENGSQNFVNELNGTIKNLTFVGEVKGSNRESSGFVANKNNGTIKNVFVDVFYQDGNYKSSVLTSEATSGVGIIAGFNYGTIEDAYSYGASIVAPNSMYTGGMVGQNFGKIVSSGVEFYLFNQTNADGSTLSKSNSITAGGVVGGIVGYADGKSRIEKSYAYAYSLIGNTNDYKSIISNDTAAVGAFMGNYTEGATVVNSFAYLGNLKNPTNSSTNTTVTHFINSYLTYKVNDKNFTMIYKDVEFSYINDYVTGNLTDCLLSEDDIPTNYADPTTGSAKWNAMVASLDDVWEIKNIDAQINFGFMYLKDTAQSAAVDISNVNIANNTSPLKSLNAGNDKGILFVYNPVLNVTNPSELSQLNSYNTISIAELFGISDKQAKSLLLTSESKNISISTNSIKVLSKNIEPFEISVHLKMNFTESKTFKFIVLNYLPELNTSIDSQTLKDNQTVLLQTNCSRSVVYTMTNTIYLNGQPYSTAKDSYSVEFDVSNFDGGTANNISVSKSNNSLVMQGLIAHQNGNVSKIESYITIDDIIKDVDFTNAIASQRNRTFDVSVYNGATSLVIENASNLVVDPSQFAVFDVLMKTDASNDNLVVGMSFGELQIQPEIKTENSASFVIDSKLTLEVSWTKQSEESADRYRVLVKIKDSQKHLIVDEYENITVNVNAKSQESNSSYLKSVGLTVKTQKVEDIGVATYNIESRQIKNSVLYIRPADEITNTLMPSSDAIVAVTVSPAYAKMTHFTLTYNTAGSGVGTVSLSRLAYNATYGYYVNSNSTTLIENGIRVNLTETDKTGDGVYYFRLYVSSAFVANSDLKLTLTYYYNNEALISGSHNLNVSYLQNANIKVNDASTYILAKGSSATVTVTVGLNQNLYDLYLQNNSANISLSAPTLEIFDSYKVYTATLTADVDAKLEGNKDSGIFYVCASVERVINNIQEIKVSKATLCLVDFSVNGNGIKVKSSGGTSTYNGKSYDVFYSYVNSTEILNFDYPMIPNSYEYDKNDQSQVNAVEKMMQERQKFEKNNFYKDEDVGYYINYVFNEDLGLYESVSLKRQLWYATNETTASAIYNDNYGTITQNDAFYIDEVDADAETSYLTITGRRTGRQLMKLQTTVIYQGIEFVYEYYFLVVVDIWSDEDTPTQIDSGEQFVDYLSNSELPDDYILMDDIVLNEYTPLSTDLIKSFDGNGYTIHLNSFAMPEGNSLNLALFNQVNENTTLKNIRVNIYNSGQISVDINQYKTINIAGFALENNGVIYNCEVVSYYDKDFQSSTVSGDNGLVVKYTMGQNTDPIDITSAMNIESYVSGFVGTNNASIMNSRVGGKSFRHIIEVAGVKYVKTQTLGTFVLNGQGEVAGFVNNNAGSGYISASFAGNIQIYNNMASTTSLTAGFVLHNSNNIQNSYIEGVGELRDSKNEILVQNSLSNIKALGIIAGFVYDNAGLVKNSYSNIAIENSESKGSMVAGFVYRNEEGAEITLCYTACLITKTDINQMQFSGVDDFANSLNFGSINFSYFYNQTRSDDTNQTKITNGALAVSDVVDNKDVFYGFSFSSEEDAYDGIWKSIENGISLVSANQIALSNRYAKTTGNLTSIFYNKNIMDADTMTMVDLSYGSENNPIIIRNATDFAMATGKATTKEISSYKEYYNDKEVFGNYRVVNNIDMSEIDQNSENENSIKLTTTSKTFKGLLDGNGFTISNINLGSSVICENYGLFAKLDNAVVMNLDFVVDSIHNSQANIVGTLAGTAINTRILAINLSPVQSQGNSDNTSILGNNIVGGVVGMLLGESRMSDIHAKDIEIYSSYYQRGKTVTSNNKYTGDNIREYVNLNNPLQSRVKELSYAGAIAGYVDIYSNVNSDFVKYYSDLDVSDFDIVTVYVSDAVNIYGEVAGGLFGYVGNSTLIYDATLNLDADMNRTHPSYIISKNLYSGGLIGENYGGLFAVSASYETNLQKTIEEGESGYYKGNLSAERGQESIFSYTSLDEGFISNTNDPLFVGGLVGYMGGGYINIGYNKLNVISHSANTYAVGGVIGFAGYSEKQFDLTILSDSPKVNIFLNEVYASGDVYNEKGVSAGIIGGIERTDSGISVVGLKNALAVNYYSYLGLTLVGGEHFIVAGKIFDTSSGMNIVSTLNENMYLVNSDNNYANILDGVQHGASGSITVGGYNAIRVGTGTDDINIKPYGFGVKWVSSTDASEKIFENILKVESIGKQDSMSSAYAKMYNYFLANGWSDEFWSHTEKELFPHIELLPKLNILFWDDWNTSDVLKDMKNSAITVVVRGKVNEDDNDHTYRDINLTNKSWSSIEGFRGKLVSYYSYMNSDDQGTITDGLEILGGGYSKSSSPTGSADRVGIIINKPLFTTLEPSVTIEGLNFYFYNDKPNETDYSFVDGAIKEGIVRNCNFVLNQGKTISTVMEKNLTGQDDVFVAGLVAGVTYATSFINVNMTFRKEAYLVFEHKDTTEKAIVSMGGLVGFMIQNTSKTSISIEQINIINESKEVSAKIDFKTNNYVEKLYAGTYSGVVAKNAGARVLIGLSKLGNVDLSVSSNETKAKEGENVPKETEYYIGGYIGKVDNVNTVSLSSPETVSEESKIMIYLKKDIDCLYAGLGFGTVERSSLAIENDGVAQTTISGGIYQYGDIVTKKVNIGGIAGKVNSNTEIKGFVIDLNVGKIKVSSAGKDTSEKIECPNYFTDADKKNNIFDNNWYDYNTYLSPFITYGDTDDSIGGFIGYASGVLVKLNGNCTITGNIDVAISKENSNVVNVNVNKVISIGGMIGKTVGSVESRVNSLNTMNISVKESGLADGDASVAYVGGMIGNIASTDDTDLYVKLNEGTSTSRINFSGNVLSDVKNIKFGGGVGFVGRTDYTNDKQPIFISSVVFGGTLKIYGKNVSNGNVSVGGVVGEYSILNENSSNLKYSYSISQCFSYGDVFVMNKLYDYSENSSVLTDQKLNSYYFGGIVGNASYINIKGCYSLMTSFNNRLSSNGVNEIGGYEVGAISGGNSEIVNFDSDNPNYYSSGVCLAYQEKDKLQNVGQNIDVSYGRTLKSSSYNGYTSRVSINENETTKDLENEIDILSFVNQYVVGSNELEAGHKLNPYKWEVKDRSKQIKNASKDEELDKDKYVQISGNSHNITWVAMMENLSGLSATEKPIADNITNLAFVGNGHTFGRDVDVSSSNDLSKNETPKSLGGVVNSMGYEPKNDTANKPNFNIVSGLIVEANIAVDINVEGNAAIYSYGGVAGEVYGNSFIYGVGIKGDLSVGGTNLSLRLGGIAGMMYTGMIDNCYVDADITYRANSTGIVSGVANLSDKNTTIKSTYSSGLIETYLNNNIYTFANSISKSNTTSNDIWECYSITQIKRNDVLGTVSTTEQGHNYFISTSDEEKINIIGNVINGCYDVEVDKDEKNEQLKLNESEKLSLSYDADSIIQGRHSIFAPTKQSDTVIKPDNKYTSSSWYFSPYINYGYAAHGFGYLKNVTTYLREETVKEVSAESSETNPAELKKIEYQYTPITYSGILENNFGDDINGNDGGWFLGVPSSGKFKQMFETIKNTDSTDSHYDKDYKFVLRYDFNMSIFSGSNLGINIGKSDKNLIIDGNNKTLDFSHTQSGALSTAIFGTVYGDIDNINIKNINVTSSSGTLANEMYGNLNNVTVIGNLESNGTYVGGVVGKFKGNIVDVDAVVNVTTKSEKSITGGVVGYFVGTDIDSSNNSVTNSIKYASNSGSILNSNGNTSSGKKINNEDIIVIIEEKDDSSETAPIERIHSIVGGVVGYAEGGEVSYSFNANSVLDGFTYTGTGTVSSSYFAGGIVGYADKTEIANCYNTGFIGAGHYKLSGYSFAGGIFAYGNSTKIENCANDGQINSIAQRPANTNYQITSEVKEDGKSSTEAFEKSNIADLSYEVTITYSPKINRKVYGFGIGFIGKNETKNSETGIDGCYSSTINVVNDGSLGEITETQILTFDRQNILDNGNGSLDFYGKFTSSGSTNINGYDAYGFPSKIYMKDKIERTYGNPDDTNNIKQKEQSINLKTTLWWGVEDYEGIYNWGENSKWEKHKEQIKDGNSSALFSANSLKAYFLSAETDYYRSCSFKGYENLLKETGSIIAYDCNAEKRELENGKNVEDLINVEKEISKIEDKKEQNDVFKKFTIDGKMSSIVFSANNIKTIFAPYEYKIETDFPIEANKIAFSSLSDRSFSISGGEVIAEDGTRTPANPQYYTFEYKEAKGENGEAVVHVVFHLYFAQKVEGTLNATISYTTTMQSIDLGKNNVFSENNELYIILQDNGGNAISKKQVEMINKGEVNFKVHLNGNLFQESALTNDKFLYGNLKNFGEVPYIKYNSSKHPNIFNGQTLKIELISTKIEEKAVLVEIKTENNSAEFTIKDTSSGETYPSSINAKFTGYKTDSMSGVYSVSSFSKTIESGGYVIGKKALLDSEYISTGIEELAFGNNNGYEGKYKSKTWTLTDNSLDNYLVEISKEGDEYYICIKEAEIVFGREQEISGKNYDENALNDFIRNVFGKFEIYYSMNNQSEKIQSSTSIKAVETVASKKNDLKLEEIFELSSVKANGGGEFTTQGEFSGSYTQFINAEGEGISTNIVTKYGVDFYEKIVTYKYSYVKAVLYGLQPMGYELTYNGNSPTIGYFANDDAHSSLTFEKPNSGDKILVKYNITNYQGLGDNISLSRNEEEITIVDSDGIMNADDPLDKFAENREKNGTYTITKGKEQNPVTKKEENFVQTSHSFNRIAGADTLYQYNYKIYESGIFSVEYIYQEISGEETDKTTKNSVKYVYDGDNQMYVLRYNRLHDGSLDWQDCTSDKKIGYDADAFLSHKVGTLWLKIDVNVIVSYFDATNILFSRNTSKLSFVILGKSSISAQYSSFSDDLNLSSGLKEKFDGVSNNDDKNLLDGMIPNSFEYLNSQGQWKNSDRKIDADKYGLNKYKYRFKKMVSNDIPITDGSLQNGNEDKNNDIVENIIIESDIHFGDVLPGNNNSNIIGNGHIMRFVSNRSNSISLFEENKKNIFDLSIIGITSMEHVEGEDSGYAMLTKNNQGSLRDLNFFGNIRNIKYSIGNNVYPIIKENQIYLDKIKSIKSYIGISGLNAETDENVYCIISDKLTYKENSAENEITDKDVYSSKNFIFSGNGGHGANGNDKQSREDSSLDGGDGHNGGDGGDISIQTETFGGIVRVGVAGAGGNGGNGNHGYFKSSQALGGGKAGERANKGKDGTLSGKAKTVLEISAFSDKQMNGNGGIGGFGRIVGNTYYTSGGGGGSTGAGGAGTESNSYLINDDGNKHIYVGYTSKMHISTVDHLYHFWGHGDKKEDWGAKIQEEMGNSGNVQTSGGTGGSGGGGQVYNSQLYVSAQIQSHRWIISIGLGIQKGADSRMVWFSGEVINSSGTCYYSN